jgi:hypothetical protein
MHTATITGDHQHDQVLRAQRRLLDAQLTIDRERAVEGSATNAAPILVNPTLNGAVPSTR